MILRSDVTWKWDENWSKYDRTRLQLSVCSSFSRLFLVLTLARTLPNAESLSCIILCSCSFCAYKRMACVRPRRQQPHQVSTNIPRELRRIKPFTTFPSDRREICARANSPHENAPGVFTSLSLSLSISRSTSLLRSSLAMKTHITGLMFQKKKKKKKQVEKILSLHLWTTA